MSHIPKRVGRPDPSERDGWTAFSRAVHDRVRGEPILRNRGLRSGAKGQRATASKVRLKKATEGA